MEEERFKWLTHLPGPVLELSDDEFRWLLDGLDLKHLKPHRALKYRTVLWRARALSWRLPANRSRVVWMAFLAGAP